MEALVAFLIVPLAFGIAILRRHMLKKAEKRKNEVSLNSLKSRSRIAAAVDRKIEVRLSEKKAGMLSLETTEPDQGRLSISKSKD